ncbi:unnamed protein product [Pleuronectes platessa]|uniref:Uncharacterized protein n=1 Tax=Pleuronectes platessa TaxID=8262 RepID=A0A9N7V3W1_PLEPL|nr:unnamed protein product [Pleuronectes platessa]
MGVVSRRAAVTVKERYKTISSKLLSGAVDCLHPRSDSTALVRPSGEEAQGEEVQGEEVQGEEVQGEEVQEEEVHRAGAIDKAIVRNEELN